MRRATGATQGGATTSMRPPPDCASRRARSLAMSGCAISMSPIQLGATTRRRARSMPFGRGAFVQILRAAVGTKRLAVLDHVEENARVPRPERRAGHRAVQRQVLLGPLDPPSGIRIAHFPP